MNFKLLMKIQELVENTSDIKLKNKPGIISGESLIKFRPSTELIKNMN